ncbi:MAG: CvpA family protein [Spirochaetia bacterium]|jgi:membrane protein required for colicin V production
MPDGISILDIVFLLILLILIIRGGFRGFVTEISLMAAPILGILCAVLFSNMLSDVTAMLTGAKDSIWNHIIAFLIIFLLVYLLVYLIQGFFLNLIGRLNLENLDRALGVILGLVEGVLVVAILLIIAHWLPWEGLQQLLQHSIFNIIFTPFLPSMPDIFNLIPLREACLKI